jgi:hypothetical protein
MSNNIRFDLSDRLIHFFRQVDLEGDSAPAIQPEHIAFNSYVEGTVWPALFLLRCAVRSHRLWATWSVRKGVRTIFGPRPAVCFSEMPLAAFLESSRSREAAGQAMSGYALTFPKAAMHAVGANPVIYGLTERNVLLPKGLGGGARSLPPEVLPEPEQYRYVTYNPSGPYKVDWMHEREWRWPWPYPGSLAHVEQEFEEYGLISDAADIPGFDFADSSLRGIGIIVKSAEDARKLKYDVLALVDRGVVHRNHFDHILVQDLLPDTSGLIGPDEVQTAIDGSLIDFSGYFDLPDADVEQIVSDFSGRVQRLEARAPKMTSPPLERGGCWLWFHDNTNRYVRALVQAGRVTVNKEGRYVASLDELDSGRELRERQQFTLELARELQSEICIHAGYFLVVNSFDPDETPFFIDCPPKDDLYHNRG